jgi:hypothetical protein
MNRQEFEAGLDRHGGDLSRWPGGLAEAAARLVATDGDAARRLAEARRLDDLLAAAVRPAAIEATLVGRIVAGAQGEKQGNGTQLRPTPRLAAIASLAMAAALIVGFTAGYLAVPDDGEDAIASLIFGATEEDIGDWL